MSTKYWPHPLQGPTGGEVTDIGGEVTDIGGDGVTATGSGGGDGGGISAAIHSCTCKGQFFSYVLNSKNKISLTKLQFNMNRLILWKTVITTCHLIHALHMRHVHLEYRRHILCILSCSSYHRFPSMYVSDSTCQMQIKMHHCLQC